MTVLLDIEGPRALRATMTTAPQRHAPDPRPPYGEYGLARPTCAAERSAVRRVGLTLHPGGRPVEDTHLRVRLPAAEPWRTLGDVLTARGSGDQEAAELAARCPGALVVAVHQGTRCWLRLRGPGGDRLALGATHFAGLPWRSWASLAHAWLVAGLPAAELLASRVRVLRISRGTLPSPHAVATGPLRAAPGAPSPRG